MKDTLVVGRVGKVLRLVRVMRILRVFKVSQKKICIMCNTLKRMNLCQTLIWTTFNFFVNIYFAFQKFFFFERFNRFHIKLDFKVFQVWFVTLCRNLFICMFVLRLVAGCLLCCWKTSNIPQNKHCNCNLDKTPDTSHKLNCPVTRRKPSLIIPMILY